MKLLFIENRHKTYFFDAIANELNQNGHEIHWLIQNKQFLPQGNSKTHIIDYPTGKEKYPAKIEEVEEVIKSDRQLNHFNKKDTSSFYYYNNKIETLLKMIRPDFVFGESTAFHELLTIHNCKKHNILYLNPSTCRYPVGRFSFYKFDTLQPYSGSNEILSTNDAEAVINQITNRKTVPDYMKPSPVSKGDIISDKVQKIYGYFNGEKYNTPSPLQKYKAEKTKNRNIKIWNSTALKDIKEVNLFKVLYPLQMQPEANIDVWGRKFRNQTLLIRDIAEKLPNNCLLYLKPNPKSKYELTSELISLINGVDNIKHLHHSTIMDDVLPQINLVITVTGTIAIECLLNNKPIITMVKTINNEAKNCIHVSSLSKDLEPIIKAVKNNSFDVISELEKIEFVNTLNSSSFKGVVSDPFSDANCVSKININSMVNAFNQILTESN